jgi:hypothetical protein
MASLGKINLAEVTPNHPFVHGAILFGAPKPSTASKSVLHGKKPIEGVKDMPRKLRSCRQKKGDRGISQLYWFKLDLTQTDDWRRGWDSNPR